MVIDKDLIVHDDKPLVKPVNRFEEEMYNEMIILNKRIKVIQTILEECNEKQHTNDSNGNNVYWLF